jgi:hypothetical protein
MELHKYMIKRSMLFVYSRGRKMPWKFSAKKAFLDMGMALLVGMIEVKPWIIHMTVDGKYHSVHKGVADPVVVCLARRAFTVRNTEEHLILIQQTLDAPTVADARKELFSGKDAFGGKWPAPKTTETSLSEYVDQT